MVKAGKPHCSRGVQPGFVLPALLIALAIGGLALAQAHITASYRLQREAEVELRFRGAAYAAAIRSFYFAATDPKHRRLPATVDDLLRDPRFPKLRHLREAYADPMFNALDKKPFRLVRGAPSVEIPDGIIGVVSGSDRALLDQRPARLNPAAAAGISEAQDLEFLADFAEPDAAAPQ